MNQQPVNELVAIGIIKKSVGLNGECYVEAFGNILQNIELPAELYIGNLPEDNILAILEKKSFTLKGFKCKFRGYENIDDVQKIKGFYLFYPRNKLPDLPKGKYYLFELTGLKVINKDTGNVIGLVTNAIKFPTIDSLEIEKNDKTKILLPLNKDVINSINLDKGTIEIIGSMLEEII
jgi:16S rRNA processing protein RimM